MWQMFNHMFSVLLILWRELLYMILYYVIKFFLNAITHYLSTNVNVWGVNMFVLYRSFAMTRFLYILFF